MSDFDLSGRTALVTGASSGIGTAIAQRLKAAGAKVAISGTREAALEAVATELGGETPILPCNLRDRTAVAGLAGRAEEALGQVDILVNNAGITRDNLAMRLKDEDWDDVLEVDLTAGFVLAKTLMRAMMKRRHGRIIGITSIVGVTGNPGQANYAAAKAGMIGMSKALAQEVAARNITVNCVAPGFIETPMTEALNDSQKDGLQRRIPMGRLGQGEDVAAAVHYFASDAAGYVTGQTLHVNGGMAMI